ncbi:MAG TPA: IS1595 family transposase [Bryobacteraceae bacterium]|jgi:transposase-like protein|nr:IS1595 family transposase [Bryobacteraceae bacterium]
MEQPKTLLEAISVYGNIDVALNEAADSRWPGGVACVHCGADSPMFLKTRKIWKCSKCRKQFSFKAGTLLEDSPIGLNKWLPAIWMIANARNGISSHELGRAIGVTQKTAWFILHRIRLAMQDEATGGKLDGEVEVDETFIGGKARNMHKSRRWSKIATKAGPDGKELVLGMVERGGRVRAIHVERRSKPVLQHHIRQHVEAGTAIFTDALKSYDGLNDFEHKVVDHAVEYVRGNVHTNTMENFWNLLKRDLKGTYISVEPFHLFRYLDEQAFRYNNRRHANGDVVSDYQRFKAALGKVTGRRLTYRKLIAKEGETIRF